MTDKYDSLRKILDAAFAQAATGKGAERHANGEEWLKQPIFTIAQQVGDGFNAGQVIKKVQEAQQMAARGEYSKAQHEVLGAIVYAASLHVLWDRQPVPEMLSWEGGERPVNPGDRVQVQCRDGSGGVVYADEITWLHRGKKTDVVAFKLVSGQ